MAAEKNAQISNIVPHYVPHFVPHSVPQSTKLVMCHIFVSQSPKFIGLCETKWRPAKWRQISSRSYRRAFSLVMADLKRS